MNKYCIVLQDINGVVKNSVGVVESSNGEATVFFIGVGKIADVPTRCIEYLDVHKTGDGYEKKICNICHILQSVDNFDKNQSNKGRPVIRRPSCNECRKQIDGVSLSLSNKRKMDKDKPSSDKMYECPICRKRCIPWVTANLVRDHDHDTGEPRMWICDSCNTGLGRFKDSTKLLEDAIAYLSGFNEK